MTKALEKALEMALVTCTGVRFVIPETPLITLSGTMLVTTEFMVPPTPPPIAPIMAPWLTSPPFKAAKAAPVAAPTAAPPIIPPATVPASPTTAAPISAAAAAPTPVAAKATIAIISTAGKASDHSSLPPKSEYATTPPCACGALIGISLSPTF